MELVVLIVAVICAYIIKGLCGFANTLIFTGISGFWVSNAVLSPIELLLSLPSNIIMVFKNRAMVYWRPAIFLSLLMMLGAIPGAIFLKEVDPTLLKILCGFVIVLIGVEMLLRKPDATPKKTNIFLTVIAGLVSGVFSGLFGVGALLAAYVSRTTEDISAFKGTLNFVFVVDNIFRFILYMYSGILTAQSFQTFLWLFPFMLIGLFTGIFLSKKIAESTSRMWVIILLIFSGVSLVVTNIM